MRQNQVKPLQIKKVSLMAEKIIKDLKTKDLGLDNSYALNA